MSEGVTGITAYQASLYADKLYKATDGRIGTDESAFTSVLKDENLTANDWTKIIAQYNQSHSKGLANTIDGEWGLSDDTKSQWSTALVSKLVEAAQGGNDDAVDLLCQEIYSSTAGKLGTADEYIKAFMNTADKETIAKVMDRYKTVTGSEIYKDIQNDFNKTEEQEILSSLDGAYLEAKGEEYTGYDDGQLTNEQMAGAVWSGVKSELPGIGLIAGASLLCKIGPVAALVGSIPVAGQIALAVVGVCAAGYMIYKGVHKVSNAFSTNATNDQQAFDAIKEGTQGVIQTAEGVYVGAQSINALKGSVSQAKANRAAKAAETTTTETAADAEAPAKRKWWQRKPAAETTTETTNDVIDADYKVLEEPKVTRWQRFKNWAGNKLHANNTASTPASERGDMNYDEIMEWDIIEEANTAAMARHTEVMEYMADISEVSAGTTSTSSVSLSEDFATTMEEASAAAMARHTEVMEYMADMAEVSASTAGTTATTSAGATASTATTTTATASTGTTAAPTASGASAPAAEASSAAASETTAKLTSLTRGASLKIDGKALTFDGTSLKLGGKLYTGSIELPGGKVVTYNNGVLTSGSNALQNRLIAAQRLAQAKEIGMSTIERAASAIRRTVSAFG